MNFDTKELMFEIKELKVKVGILNDELLPLKGSIELYSTRINKLTHILFGIQDLCEHRKRTKYIKDKDYYDVCEECGFTRGLVE